MKILAEYFKFKISCSLKLHVLINFTNILFVFIYLYIFSFFYFPCFKLTTFLSTAVLTDVNYDSVNNAVSVFIMVMFLRRSRNNIIWCKVKWPELDFSVNWLWKNWKAVRICFFQRQNNYSTVVYQRRNCIFSGLYRE